MSKIKSDKVLVATRSQLQEYGTVVKLSRWNCTAMKLRVSVHWWRQTMDLIDYSSTYWKPWSCGVVSQPTGCVLRSSFVRQICVRSRYLTSILFCWCGRMSHAQLPIVSRFGKNWVATNIVGDHGLKNCGSLAQRFIVELQELPICLNVHGDSWWKEVASYQDEPRYQRSDKVLQTYTRTHIHTFKRVKSF